MSKQKGTLRTRPKKRSLPGKNFLITIAVDQYANGIPKLANCCKDADDFGKLLVEKYQFEPAEHLPLRNQDCTRAAIIHELESHLQRLTANDNLILFISGHGEVINNSAYYLPYDARKGSTAEYLSFLDLTNRLAAIKCKHFILIYDGCYAGAIFKSTKNVGYPVTAVDYPSRYGITSSHGRELSDDGTEGENSPFVRALLGELSRNNRPLKINILADRVQDHLGSLNKDQTSVSGKLTIPGDKNGQFVFTPKKEYYQLTTALDLFKQREEKHAIQEMIMLFRTADRLPVGYEFYTAIPCFWVHLLDRFEKTAIVEPDLAHQLRNNIVRSCLVDINLLKHRIQLKNPDYCRVLESLSKNRIAGVRARLFAKFSKDFNRLFALFRIGFSAQKLDNAFRDLGIISFEKMYSHLNQLLYELLVLIYSADQHQGEIYDPIRVCEELVECEHEKYALSGIKAQYLQLDERGNGIFFIPVISQRIERLREQTFDRSKTEDVLRIEKNRLRRANSYLLTDLKGIRTALDPEDEAVFPRPQLPFSQMELDEEFMNLVDNESIDTDYLTRIFLDRIIHHAKRFELEEILRYVEFELGDDAFVHSFQERVKSFQLDHMRGLLNIDDEMSHWQASLRYLKHFVDAMRSAQNHTPVLAKEEKELRAFYALADVGSQLDFLRATLKQQSIHTFFNCLLNFKPATARRQEIGLLRKIADLIQEDELFTDKSDELINQRRNELTSKLLDLLVELEQDIPKTSTAGHSDQMSDDDRVDLKRNLELALEYISQNQVLKTLQLLESLPLRKESKTELDSIFNVYANHQEAEVLGTKSREQIDLVQHQVLFRIITLVRGELDRLEL